MWLDMNGHPKGQRAYSIKTRIKTDEISYHKSAVMQVREHIPLKQGLRQFRKFEYIYRDSESESIFH